jgi:hypothetical protein
MRDTLARLFDHDATVRAAPDPAAHGSAPRERTLVLWLLCGWTVLQALGVLLLSGAVARVLAGGMADPDGRPLFAVQLLVAAAVYGWLAARPALHRTPAGWLPLAAQALTALVLLLTMTAGGRSFGSSGLVFFVSLGFTLLLAGFRLAGEPYMPPPQAARPPAGSETMDAATERLVPPAGGPEPARPRPHDRRDDDILGA